MVYSFGEGVEHFFCLYHQIVHIPADAVLYCFQLFEIFPVAFAEFQMYTQRESNLSLTT